MTLWKPASKLNLIVGGRESPADVGNEKVILPDLNPTNPQNTRIAQSQQSSETPNMNQLQQSLMKHVVGDENHAIGPTKQPNVPLGSSDSKSARQGDIVQALEIEDNKISEG